MAGVKMRIGALDAGMVFRADGTLEVMLPNVPAHRLPDNAVIAGALLWASARPEVMEQIMSQMESESTGNVDDTQ